MSSALKIQFKKQAYQEAAVKAVVDCFVGQPNSSGIAYRVDPGRQYDSQMKIPDEVSGFKNAELQIKPLVNIQKVQRHQNLNVSQELVRHHSPSAINLDIEMETGTGKTYVYIKTIFELNKQYGWTKFIIVVPSIAIREGVQKSIEITADHFQQEYQKRIKSFIYNSKTPHDIESFSSDAGINLMIINSQAFNATGEDARRIYEELDSFGSRRPIDVIKANNPILIIDEPQKLEGTEKKPSKTLESLANFNPLFILRYTATPVINYNKIYRLDAMDAYNQKLVKKINVRAITVKGTGGTDAHLHLSLIEVSNSNPPIANLEIEVKQANGVVTKTRKVKQGDNLYTLSNELEAYKEGYTVSEIDANTGTVTFLNGVVIQEGEPEGNVNESVLRRLQIRETIKAHFEKERLLYAQGIKVLSLFFIDEVAKYRDYDAEDEKGVYAKLFEEEYHAMLQEQLGNPELVLDDSYKDYISSIDVENTHNGYFSVDKKGKVINSKLSGRGVDKTCDDVDAYDLILKRKEQLLSFEEPTRFIFSHSALREGWDNPNVFVICTLKQSDNTVTKRQEVGRGLRIAVNQNGERQDNPDTVHNTNVLTVIANESYSSFVGNLQKELLESLSDRPTAANEEYFTNKVLQTGNGDVVVDEKMARQVYRYLIKNDYIDDNDQISDEYHQAKENNQLAPLPEDLAEYASQVFTLINSVFSGQQMPQIDNDRAGELNKLNSNFHKKEFQALWKRINRKAIYQVDFDSEELISKSVAAINKNLYVTPIEYVIDIATMADTVSKESLADKQAFKKGSPTRGSDGLSSHSQVRYDLVGKVMEEVDLTRITVAKILSQIHPDKFAMFHSNPEEFILHSAKLIKEQKAATVIEQLTYDLTAQTYEVDIFTKEQIKAPEFKPAQKLTKHVFDYIKTDSKVEKKFVSDLEIHPEVVVYSKLPRGFSIPTPVGSYNPDWAIAFEEGKVKHIYFVAETKGSMQSMQLKGIENHKIDCARKFFDTLSKASGNGSVKYDVIDNYESLLQKVSSR